MRGMYGQVQVAWGKGCRRALPDSPAEYEWKVGHWLLDRARRGELVRVLAWAELGTGRGSWGDIKRRGGNHERQLGLHGYGFFRARIGDMRVYHRFGFSFDLGLAKSIFIPRERAVVLLLLFGSIWCWISQTTELFFGFRSAGPFSVVHARSPGKQPSKQNGIMEMRVQHLFSVFNCVS
ncbi:hypothetical protein K505DRAFT_112220 [Melanomma pulvis-pyrius CBS 109.77]|uniref:Uncharacterized protein n=1 Tax=Melanomma pulvis-pyrius CBS 109.77 TaxID=1314802 RepID=A0A6A6WVM5_9PLEO|nr:hypothetical protein K505DRAFT_112220 [Melanomma pulvis-pyrius CBS 109.77]